jgi:hypothetical protein
VPASTTSADNCAMIPGMEYEQLPHEANGKVCASAVRYCVKAFPNSHALERHARIQFVPFLPARKIEPESLRPVATPAIYQLLRVTDLSSAKDIRRCHGKLVQRSDTTCIVSNASAVHRIPRRKFAQRLREPLFPQSRGDHSSPPDAHRNDTRPPQFPW